MGRGARQRRRMANGDDDGDAGTGDGSSGIAGPGMGCGRLGGGSGRPGRGGLPDSERYPREAPAKRS